MKMSKSNPSDLTKILITDTPEEIRRKIKSAVTDSIESIRYDPENRPGISNLIDIYQSISGQELEQVQRRFQDKSVVDLKSELIELLIEHFRPFNTEFSRLVNSREDVEKIYLAGSQKAAGVANLTLSQVKKHIGLD
jgi:tryptophanyl-tRNA synthetase